MILVYIHIIGIYGYQFGYAYDASFLGRCSGKILRYIVHVFVEGIVTLMLHLLEKVNLRC